MPLVVPDTVEVRLNFTLSGADWAQNVLHYLVPGGFEVNSVNAEEWAGKIIADFIASGSLRGQLHNGVNLASIGFRDIRTASNPEFIDDTSAPGTGGTSVAPRQLCVVSTLRTALAGRSYRGRIYFGGFASSAISTGGFIQTTTMSSVKQFSDALMSETVDGSLCVLGVTSRTLGVTNEVVSTEVRDNIWDWQRSRADTD